MMKIIKKHWKKILILLTFALICYINFCSRFRMVNLPEGEYLESLDSPNGEYTLKSYRYSGGATMDWSLRVEVVNNNTKKEYNIYWAYHEREAEMNWIDEETIIINGVQLNIHKDYYHW